MLCRIEAESVQLVRNEGPRPAETACTMTLLSYIRTRWRADSISAATVIWFKRN